MTGSEATKRAPRLASTATPATETRLARRAAKRDERAFAAIFDRYHQEIYRFCLSILGNEEDARDALQNTMVKALQALPGEEREIRLKPWLYRVAHNESIDLIRKRRETARVDPELAAPGEGLAETAAQRERLRQLLRDLSELPERQRAALLMRELGGLGFEQIAEAFDTSSAVARQTVYEARLSLRSLEEGREMSCEEVMHRLSNADGRVSRRRDLRAHLRACSDCRAFREAIESRRHDLAAIAPLPAIASAGVLQAILGGAHGTAGAAAGAGGATVAAGAGKAVSAGLVAKSVATVAVVAAVGVSAADRGGLIQTGLPGGSNGATPAQQAGESGASVPASGAGAEPASAGTGGSTGHKDATQKSSRGGERSAGSGQAQGASGSLPPASQHGRETAAAHRKGAAASHGQGHGHAAPAASHRGSHRGHGSAHAKGASHSHPAPPPPPPPKPVRKEATAQPTAETAPTTEQSSGSAGENSESGSGSEGMP